MEELVTLDNLAKMLEKPVQKIYQLAIDAKAIVPKQYDDNIFIDVNIFQDYLDNCINEDLKYINNEVVMKVTEKIRRGAAKNVHHFPKELLDEYDKICEEIRDVTKRKNIDLSKILITK